MTTALIILIAQGALGALDTVIYHELHARLPSTFIARRELRLHASRDFAYAAIFGGLAWFEPHGGLAWGLAAILLFEIIITLWDFIEEDLTRKLPGGERVMHTIMAILYGAFLANLLPELWRWCAEPTGLVAVDYGITSWIMTLFAVGVFLSGVRDLAASFRLDTAAAGSRR
jgi:uncharacterized protein